MVEQGAKPPEVKAAEKQPPPAKEPTDEKVHTAIELQTAVSKGLESVTKQHSIQQQATEAAKADSAKHLANLEFANEQLQLAKKEIDDYADKLGDDTSKKAFLDRHAIAEENRKVATLKADATSKMLKAEEMIMASGLSMKASELSKETGIDAKDLEGCTTEEQMTIKSLEYKIANPPKTEEAEAPKFDSATSTGGGDDWASLSPIEKSGRELKFAREQQRKRGTSEDTDYKP